MSDPHAVYNLDNTWVQVATAGENVSIYLESQNSAVVCFGTTAPTDSSPVTNLSLMVARSAFGMVSIPTGHKIWARCAHSQGSKISVITTPAS